MTARGQSAIGLLLVQIAYLVWMILVGRFISGDEIAYKSHGREWARSGRWAAPELTGSVAWADPANPEEVPSIIYPPLYTLGFGCFVKVAGFGPRSNVAYDALIHVALSWAVFLLSLRLFATYGGETGVSARGKPMAARAGWYAMLAAAAILPLGTAGRPDELGSLLATLGVTVLLAPLSTPRVVASAALFGLGLGTSVAAALLGLWPLFIFVKRRQLGLSVLFGALVVVIFAFVMAPLVLAKPEELHRLTRFASESVKTDYAWAISNSWRYGRHHYLAALAAVVVAIAHALTPSKRRSTLPWMDLWLPPLAALSILLVLLPVKHYYVWVLVPAMFASASVAVRLLDWPRTVSWFVAITLCLLWIAASARFALMAAVRANLPADQRLEHNITVLRRLIPPRVPVLTYDYWPALMTSNEVYSTDSEAPPWNRIEYVVLTGNGSGSPGRRQTLSAESEQRLVSHYEVVYDGLNRRPFRIGPVATNSAWGYGPLVLKRKR